ncbi:MAG: hypothetical protein KAG53_02115 [Endozoicomonadaceae bacterium]|nr:hypothetical protein [Endozoicomonadaceae bacterium]
MSINALTELLREHIGLNPESIGHEAIEQSIKRRMKLSGIDCPVNYFIKVTDDPLELSSLVDEITVGETWFFREFPAFSVLQKQALNRRCNGYSQFRVASMPCSSGEEVYSITMALLDLGFQENQLKVDGYDINREVVSKARKGEYASISFRSAMPDFSKHYLKKHGDGFFVKPSVKQSVSFQQANLLELADHVEPGSYDVIFCRNFLIYLDEPSRRKMVNVLRHSLTEDGVLIVSRCEAHCIGRMGFQVLDQDKSFAFSNTNKNKNTNKDALKCDSPSPEKSLPKALSHTLSAEKSRKQGLNHSVMNPQNQVTTSQKKAIFACASRQKSTLAFQSLSDELLQPVADKDNASEWLIKDCKERLYAIEILLNSGKLEQAISACRQLMRQHPESVDVQFMMGVISEQKGECALAYRYFRKVLYLQPEHHEALLHSAMVCEQQGEIVKAENLRARLNRLIN